MWSTAALAQYLVYEGKTPIGWCQYGSKEELPRIDAGRNYRKVGPPVDAEKFWRITCFFVDKDYRGKGVSKIALKRALESIKQQREGIVEAYAVISKKMAAVPGLRWFGTLSMFEEKVSEPLLRLGPVVS